MKYNVRKFLHENMPVSHNVKRAQDFEIETEATVTY